MDIGEAAAGLPIERLKARRRGEPDLPAGGTVRRLPVEFVVCGTMAPPLT